MAFSPGQLQLVDRTTQGLAGEGLPSTYAYGPTDDNETGGTTPIFPSAPVIATQNIVYSNYFTRPQVTDATDGGQGFSGLKDLRINPGSILRIVYLSTASVTEIGRKQSSYREYLFQGFAQTGSFKGQPGFTRIT